MAWEIEFTDQFDDFWSDLNEEQQIALEQRVILLQQAGPKLRRPVVGEIIGSRFDPQMKELICGTFRVLFMFDPRRTAILLMGGNKADDSEWNDWYDRAIPAADQLYEEHLLEIEKE